MKAHPAPVYVASEADKLAREATLKTLEKRTMHDLQTAVDNNEDGSLTFYINMVSDTLVAIERELLRSVYIVTALDPNLVEV